jgi:hypothetical protein
MFITTSYRKSLSLIAAVFAFVSMASAQQESSLIEVSGRVASRETKEPIPNVSVNIKGTVAGTITNSVGQFKLRTRLKFPFKLIFSSIGFEPQEYEITGVNSRLDIELTTQTVVLGKDSEVASSHRKIRYPRHPGNTRFQLL